MRNEYTNSKSKNASRSATGQQNKLIIKTENSSELYSWKGGKEKTMPAFRTISKDLKRVKGKNGLEIQTKDFKLVKGFDEEYPTYENFNAINVNKTKDIPVDYNGFMGVPITFLDKYNPDQFEIIGLGISNSGLEIGVQPYKKEHKKYRKEVQKRGAVNGDLYMMVDGVVTVPYARVIIKNKKI